MENGDIFFLCNCLEMCCFFFNECIRDTKQEEDEKKEENYQKLDKN
jgi:hypothetical protein